MSYFNFVSSLMMFRILNISCFYFKYYFRTLVIMSYLLFVSCLLFIIVFYFFLFLFCSLFRLGSKPKFWPSLAQGCSNTAEGSSPSHGRPSSGGPAARPTQAQACCPLFLPAWSAQACFLLAPFSFPA